MSLDLLSLEFFEEALLGLVPEELLSTALSEEDSVSLSATGCSGLVLPSSEQPAIKQNTPKTPIFKMIRFMSQIYFTIRGVNSKKFFTIFFITMSNVEIFDTTFAMTILVIMAVCIPSILLLANWFLHPGKVKNVLIKGSAYECGLAHVSGTANERYPVKYYMVAMLFLVFDLEVAFLYPWTVQFLAGGWELLFVLLGFLFILEAGYIYLYKKGVLDWTSIKD